jgi:CBS-domain-containing membrane protein
MTKEVRYCFEDEETEHVARNMAQIQVRRLPAMSRDKRLGGVISLGDLAREEPDSATTALHGIARPSKQHDQSRVA